MSFRLLLTPAIGWGLCFLCGCQQATNALPPAPTLYPVKGKVTADGKPLAHAVVTFLQVDEKGTTSVGETDEEGTYELTYGSDPGTAAARYKVAISYLMGTDGTVYGLGPRSGLSKPYGMITAKELVVPEWSNLGLTTHQVTVSEPGGTFDFDIKEPLLPPPTPETPAKGAQVKKAPEPPSKEGGEVARPVSPAK